MNSPRYARLAATLLSREAPSHATVSEGNRDFAVARIEQALIHKAKRRQAQRWAGVAVALTLAAAFAVRVGHAGQRAQPVVTAVGQPTGSGARVLTPTGSLPLRSGGVLPPGGRLVADAHGGASLQLSTGTQIAIEHDASLAFREAGPTEHFVLSQGGILARVAKLHAGERFIVSTPDAEIEVHGTVFRVAVVEPNAECSEHTQTRVEVIEGIVEVRAGGRSSYVHPGEHWPAGCSDSAAATANLSRTTSQDKAPAPASSYAPRAQTRALPQKTASLDLVGQASSAAAVAEAKSQVKEQNDLFAQGVALRRAGDTSGALAKFETLMTRYPASPLAESSAAERMRSLGSVNRAAAQRAAREYLARFPQGFARSDANAILSRP